MREDTHINIHSPAILGIPAGYLVTGSQDYPDGEVEKYDPWDDTVNFTHGVLALVLEPGEAHITWELTIISYIYINMIVKDVISCYFEDIRCFFCSP